MSALKVGVIGCGAICGIYITNIKKHYKDVDVVSCSDLYMEKALATKEKYGLEKAYTTEEMLADPEIDIVLNLTVPNVHYELNKAILKAGKHIYCEKPLAVTAEQASEIAELAKELGLRVSSAPDIFLGGPIQTARKLIDEGAIGDVLGFTANFCSPGSEFWHPTPQFLYEPGGGPMKDMGPYFITALISLLGPVKEVYCCAKASFPTRDIHGEDFEVLVPTHYAGILKFDNGVYGNINMSFDTWHHELPYLEVYGTNGMLSIPDPNMTSGEVKAFLAEPFKAKMKTLTDINDQQELEYGESKLTYYNNIPCAYSGGMNMRGIAVQEMAMAIREGRPHRASAEMGAHVVEVLSALEKSSEKQLPISISTTCERPEAFYPVAEDVWFAGDGPVDNKFII